MFIFKITVHSVNIFHVYFSLSNSINILFSCCKYLVAWPFTFFIHRSMTYNRFIRSISNIIILSNLILTSQSTSFPNYTILSSLSFFITILIQHKYTIPIHILLRKYQQQYIIFDKCFNNLSLITKFAYYFWFNYWENLYLFCYTLFNII